MTRGRWWWRGLTAAVTPVVLLCAARVAAAQDQPTFRASVDVVTIDAYATVTASRLRAWRPQTSWCATTVSSSPSIRSARPTART